MAPVQSAKQNETVVKRGLTVLKKLEKEYPDVECALHHRNAYELLVATILSAQTTDERVNIVTPALFKKYPTAKKLAAANPEEVEELIKSTGFFRNKTKSIVGMAKKLVESFSGEVPDNMDDLLQVPGVGRKTANVILSVGFSKPGLPVDTHVTRLCNLLKLVDTKDAVKIELELNEIIPAKRRGGFSLRLIEHGRRVCIARRPKCDVCVLNGVCPSAFTV